MNLRIIKAGILDTIQDLGRSGGQHLGINPGGAMDKASAQIANILVGNDRKEAVIELHFPSSEFFFEKPALIALAGADFCAHVNGEEIGSMQPVVLSKYSILQFHRLKKGARAYLAVHGGFDVPKWMDSYSTHLKAGVGGYKGRALHKDDEIPLRDIPLVDQSIVNKEYHVLPWKAEKEPDESGHSILVLPGNEWGRLTESSQIKFLRHLFSIGSHSDRMGYQLKGSNLSTKTKEELVSSAVNFGTIQLLPDGELIVLMADHQTVGGYPRIAHVIAAHHGRLAQLKPGDRVSFRLTDMDTARKLVLQQLRHLIQLQHACSFKLEQFLYDEHRS